MKKFLLLIIMFFASLCFVFAENEPAILPSQTGIVQKVEYIDIDNIEAAQTKQSVEIKLKDGNLVLVDNMLTGNPFYDIKLKKGDKVILHVEEDENGLMFSIENIQRSNTLIWLSLLFCGLLIYVGKKKGLLSLVSIVVTCILIFNLLSPMILAGINPIVGTVLICLLSTALTMYLVGGFNKKSTSATIGCVLSLIIAGIFSRPAS